MLWIPGLSNVSKNEMKSMTNLQIQDLEYNPKKNTI